MAGKTSNESTSKTVASLASKQLSNPLAIRVQYTVTDTTFFHNQPDESTSRKTYLDPLNKNVLNPIQDKNGFIYIVYTNHFRANLEGMDKQKRSKAVTIILMRK